MEQITDSIERLLNAYESGFDNAISTCECDYTATCNFAFWLREDNNMKFSEVKEFIKKFNEDTKNKHNLSVRIVGQKLLFKFSSAYDD